MADETPPPRLLRVEQTDQDRHYRTTFRLPGGTTVDTVWVVEPGEVTVASPVSGWDVSRDWTGDAGSLRRVVALLVAMDRAQPT